VALTPKTRRIRQHDSEGWRCPGTGRPPGGTPDVAVLLERLVEMTANLEQYIEHRARQIALARLSEADTTLAEHP
jgi:hypothetical protein